MANDYNQYFGYISNVFVPTIYKFSTSNYSDEEKENLIEGTISDIIAARNDYYYNMGEMNYLDYNYDSTGNLTFSNIYGTYISNLNLDEARSIASGFKQFKGNWASYELGASGCTHNGKPCNMATIGCFVTSISIVMANSGTRINSDVFDPGVLARVLKDNNSFNAGGGLVSYNWTNLAPYFKSVSSPYTESLRNYTKEQIKGIVMDYLSQGYSVVLHVKNGGHFVAVVGVEDGRIVIGDPGKSATPTYLDDSIYPEHSITGIRVYEATDVRGN